VTVKTAGAAGWRARVHAFIESGRRGGLLELVAKRAARELACLVVWVIALPVTLLLHAAGLRRLTVITQHIGHLGGEMDCFVKSRRLGDLPERRWFLLAPDGKVANHHLLDYWRNHVTTQSQPAACFLLHAMSRWLLMKQDVSHYMLRLDATSELYRVNARWRDRPPVLKLTEEDLAWGARMLGELGLAPGAWFAAIHVREPGYSPAADHVHAHRNADPLAVVPAMREIGRRGGWCLRMGDESTTPLPAIDRVIDYARHPLRSQRMDVILCARARFFLGNTSGLAFVAAAFGTPCALANMIPLSNLAPLAGDISIPKLLFHPGRQQMLRFTEVLGSRLGNYRFAKLYADEGIVPVENSAEEILELAREMLDRLEGTYKETGEDRALQERFLGLLRPGHYSYGGAARIGAAFLRRHRRLLDS
jgi:putative glycosyltransferase (TIGR04372 family)